MAIAAPAMGYESSVGVAKESSYGTANATPAFWMRPVSNTLRQLDPPLALRGPTGASVDTLYSVTRPRLYRGHKIIAGNLTFEAEFDDIGFFLMNAVAAGTVQSNLDINGSAATGEFLHTFAMLADYTTTTTPPSLTVSDINGTGDVRYTGCMIDTLEISGRADQIVTVSLDIIGQAGGDVVLDDSDTEGYSVAPFMEFHDSDWRWHATVGQSYTTLTSQTGGSSALDWAFRLENRLRAVPATGLIGRFIREPIYSGYREATLRVTRDRFDTQFFSDYFPPTQPFLGDDALAFSAGSIHLESDEVAASSGLYGFDIYSPAWLMMGEPTTYQGGAGIIPEAITLKATAQTVATAPLTMRLANVTSAAYA